MLPCRCVWNAALPLLQHNLRRHVKRPFLAAANALAAVSAPCHELRARLHFEVAKCDEADDLLMSAKAQACAAQSLDYVGKGAQVQQFRLARPLDRFLDSLCTGLHLRTSFHQAPDSPRDQAMLQVERAKEAKSSAGTSAALTQALSHLRSIELVQPPTSAKGADDHKEQYIEARQLTELWASVVKTAYKSQAYNIVLQAAPALAGIQWQAGVDGEMVTLQATCSLLETYAALHTLRAAGETTTPVAESAALPQDGASGTRTPATTPQQLRAVVLMSLQHGMQKGLESGQPWLTVNGAIAAWHACLPSIKLRRCADHVLKTCTQLQQCLMPYNAALQ